MKANKEQLNLLADYIELLWQDETPELATKNTYKVADFYDPSKVDNVLKGLSSVFYKHQDFKKRYERILTKLQANQPTVLKYLNEITKQKGLLLEEWQTKTPDTKTINEIALKHTEMVAGKWQVKDIDALKQAFLDCPKTNSVVYFLSRANEKQKIEVTTIAGTSIGITKTREIVGKLAKELELDSDNILENIYRKYPDIEILLATLLAEMRQEGSTTKYPNIKGNTPAIPKYIIDAGTHGLARAKENPEILHSLDKVYRNEQEREGVDGLAIQTQLFSGLVANNEQELAPWATVEQAIRALNIAGTTALIACIRYLHNKPSGGDIDIAELMLYDHKYKNQKLTRRAIKKADKEAFSNSLRILLSLNWAIKTKASDRTSEIKYYRLVKGSLEVSNKTGEIIKVKGLEFDSDFHDIKNNLLYVLAPEGIDYLPSPEAKSVALKIQSLFARHQKDTISGKPQEVSREWLARGSYKINSRTNELIINLLNEMVDNNLIAKWHNIKGNQALNGYDKDTYKILLYPTKEAQESYITKDQRKAKKKLEQGKQRELLTKLKKLAREQNNNKELAKYLGANENELELWLAGTNPIPDNKAGKIIV